MEEEGHIDILINNAGVFAPGQCRNTPEDLFQGSFSPFPGPTIDWTVEKMKSVYDTNVFSIVRLTSAVVPHMAKRSKGTIVNIGSIVGELSEIFYFLPGKN